MFLTMPGEPQGSLFYLQATVYAILLDKRIYYIA